MQPCDYDGRPIRSRQSLTKQASTTFRHSIDASAGLWAWHLVLGGVGGLSPPGPHGRFIASGFRRPIASVGDNERGCGLIFSSIKKEGPPGQRSRSRASAAVPYATASSWP